MSTSFRKVRTIITREGSNFLVGLKDLKNLQLIDPSFPKFLGGPDQRRKDPPHVPQPRTYLKIKGNIYTG